MIGEGGATEASQDLERDWLETMLDLMPVPLALIEGETGRFTFANRAAHRVAGGRLPLARTADDYEAVFPCEDLRGNPLPLDQYPAVRALRGEELHGERVRWITPEGPRTVVIWAETLPAMYGKPPVVVFCLQDVTEVADAEERVRRQADEIARLYRQARDAERRKDESLALLDTIFASAPIGLAFLDTDLRFIRVNQALAAMNGRPIVEHIGRTLGEVNPALEDSVGEGARRVIETGEPIVETEIGLGAPTRLGEARYWLVSNYPVRAGSSEVIGVGLVALDITQRRRTERRWRFLAHAGEMLASSLDYEETLRRLAESVVPRKADWCAVDMLQPDGRVERLAIAHADRSRERLGWEVSARQPVTLDDPYGPGAVIRTGSLEHTPDLDADMLERFGVAAEQVELARELDVSSLVCVPLVHRGRVLGALTMVGEAGRRFDSEDVELFTELARRAAVAVEHARLYEERSRIAQTLQQSLLPPHLPDIPGFEVAARYHAAARGHEVGGDFYDIFETSHGCWSVVIGDVCGKGAEAAALTALARYTLRAAAIQERSPSRVLTLLNDAILREHTDDRFCTAAYATLYESDGASPAVIACGGHPLPLAVRAGGEVEVVGSPGTLLGLDPGARFTDRTLVLAPGDALVLFTDGVVDFPSPEGVLAPGELREILSSAGGLGAEAIADAIERPLLALAAEHGARDDAAIVVIRRQ